jgi:hypothetical protein
MAKQYNKGRDIYLVCNEHNCLFRDCACTARDWTGKHHYVLGTAEELLDYYATGVELDYWRDVLCRDFYHADEVQEQPRGLSRKQKREARQAEQLV